MLEEFIALILPTIISICELMGIFVAAVSALRAFWNYCKGFLTHVPTDVKFELANGLATSLEFKMAAEILKTVCRSSRPWRECRANDGSPVCRCAQLPERAAYGTAGRLLHYL